MSSSGAASGAAQLNDGAPMMSEYDLLSLAAVALDSQPQRSS